MVAWTTASPALRRGEVLPRPAGEIVGIRYLDEQVLGALRLAPRASVFDDTRVLVDGLARLDGVADAW
jgi:hypothetical protein